MSDLKHTPGFVSEMPVHDGDGYSWGGDVIVTIDSRSINLGSSQNFLIRLEILALGRMIAAAPDMLAALIEAETRLRYSGDHFHDAGATDRAEADWAAADQARAAIAKATGETP